MSTSKLQLIIDYFPELNKDQLSQFEKAIFLYQEWNTKINVVSRKDMDYIIERHFLHSLSIAKFLKFNPNSRILDVGTGGGFPGLPLAIYFPQSKFTLADSIGKKILVVNEIAKELNLTNLKAHHTRVEDIKGQYEYIVSRAVAPMDTIKHWTNHLLNKRIGSYIFLKGGDLKEEIAQSKLKCKEKSLEDYFPLPFFETKKIIHARF